MKRPETGMTQTPLTRRAFGRGAALGAAVLAAPGVARGANPRVVVIGAGPAGATVAKYVAKDAGGAVDVVMIDKDPVHTTCFFSNLYLGGMRSFDSITHGFDTLRDKYGVRFLHGMAQDIDPEAKTVSLAGGGTVSWDALVVAPGIDFKYDLIEGYDRETAETRVPHAYQAGPQTKLLKAQLDAMEDGGLVVVAAPPNPFRCPPGPYERVSMIAHYLKANKPASSIMVLDAKDKFSKMALFQEGWERFYPGMIEWVPGEFTDGGIARVDAGAMSLTTNAGETVEAAVINVIPPQKAGRIAHMGGLIPEGSDWASVKPDTLESTVHPGVYVLGDACANGAMPKSGFSANSQAKACAMAVRAALTGSKAFPPRFRNTCWSLLADENAVKVGATYKAGETKIESTETFISATGEDDGLRAQTAIEAVGWYDGITEDIWG